MVETYNTQTQRIISEQNETLMEMATPVTTIATGVLMLPIVGFIDSKRAQSIMETVLGRIAQDQADVLIMDISGVAVVDTAVANHLIKITKAAKLMGCMCIVSGVSPAIAQTMVELGVDVGDIHTTATLKDALEKGLQETGHNLTKLSYTYA